MSTSLLDRVTHPLDAARRQLFLGSQRIPVLGPIVARRDLRVMTQTTCGVGLCGVLTFLAPGVLLVLGPVALGVPHVAADVRFLLLRRDVPRTFVAVVAIACALLAVSRMTEAVVPSWLPFGRLEVSIGWGLTLVAAISGAVARRAALRALVLAPLLLLILSGALLHPDLARLLFAYAHNVIAISLWVILYRRSRAYALPAMTLLVLLTVALLSGAALPHVSFSSPWGQRLLDEAMTLAPPGMSPGSAVGVGLSFVLLQSVHYAVWLLWIPQEDLAAEGTTTFRMSARSLGRDFGGIGLALVGAVTLLVLAAAFLDLHRTRFLYLSIATFHGYLEVAALVFFVSRGRLPREDRRALSR